MNRKRRLGVAWVAGVATLVLGSAQAAASPVSVQVEYLTTHGQSCIRAFCVPLQGGTTFSKSFTIDSTLLAIDGSYDVSSTLVPPFVFPPGTSSSALDVEAVVVGGAVVDLRVHFYASGSVSVPILGTTYSSQSFDAGDGSWSSANSSSNSLSNSSGSAGGTYALTMVPEPASAALVGLGIVLLARRARP